MTLPNSSSKQKIEESKALIIEISENNIAFKAKKLDFIELKQQLLTIKKTTALTIKIDKDVKYKKIVKLLDILNSLQLNNILLITKK